MQEANTAANARRSAATQIERMVALAAQYDQDVKKLTFAREANTLFDPLLMAVCPWCLQAVTAGDPAEGECTVCHQPLGADDADSQVDLDREIKAVKRRQSELADYLEDLHAQARTAEERTEAAIERAGDSQAALDQVMQARFAPYIDQRDLLVSSLAAATQDRQQLEQFLSMHDGAQRRRDELGRLRQQLADLQLELAGAEEVRRTRVDAVEAISERYGTILEDFQFPKLSEPHVDNRYVPHVRGLLYNQLGSAGARTLATLAWYLAIFEVVAENGGPHPGLLLIDSPQKGLSADPGKTADEYQTPSIAESVYQHLLAWTATEIGAGTQIIVVDNTPQSIAEPHVIVRYSASADDPPYGLIDDATT